MAEKELDFSLPEKKQKKEVGSKVLIILLLVLTGLTSINLYVTLTGRDKASDVAAVCLSAEQAKQLATKLAGRNLNVRAAKVWQDYLSGAKLTSTERAKALFQIATQLEKAGMYDEAIEYFYRSEMAADIKELRQEIDAHIQNCFERLGKFSALRYELMDRTSFKLSEQAGGKIVAEIGAEKITEAELDALIENDIENQLSSLAIFLTGEQLNEQKKRMLEQYKSSAVKQQFLQSWLAQEILYRQAMKDGLSEKAEVRRVLDGLARGVLSQQLMNQQIADKIHITETDLKTYYEANKGKYVEPANEEEGTAERQKSFDEIREEVMGTLVNEKRQDVQQEYIGKMMDKYNVIVHMSSLVQRAPQTPSSAFGNPEAEPNEK